MRYTPVIAALLLAFGGSGRAEEATEERGPGLLLADGGNLLHAPKSTGSRVRESKDKPSNVLREDKPADAIRQSEQRSSNVVESETLPDNVASSEELEGNILRFNASAPKRLRSPHEKPDPVRAATVVPEAPVESSKAGPVPANPDERPLWRMLERRRYAALLGKLDQLRAAHPHWRPPARMVSLAREGLLRERIERMIAEGDAAGLVVLAREHPTVFGCENIVFAWALAEAQIKLGQQESAENIAHSLHECPNEDDRIATLYKAKSWLPIGRWEYLLALEQGAQRSPQGEQKFRRLRYDYRLEQLVRASEGKEYDRAASLFATFSAEADVRKDAAAVLLGAWSYYQLQQYDAATAWFERVLAWNSANDDARRGSALCAYQQKRYDAALVQARAISPGGEGRGELLRDILVAQAQTAYSSGNHANSLDLLDAAQVHAALPRHARLQAAWSKLELGRADVAANEFAILYRESPDLESAQGLLNSMVRAGRDSDLDQLAKSEPLAGLVRRHHADRAFAEKRFMMARSLAPDPYAVAGAAAAPQLSVFSAARSKSGAAGLSRLVLQWQPSLEAALPAGKTGETRLRLDRISLDSGMLQDDAQAGQYPTVPATYAFRPASQVQGWQPRLVWRDERIQAWEFGLGLTPSGAAVSSALTGRIAFQRRSTTISLELTAYRDSVRESVLSYVGMRDPYAGAVWGRVLKNGVQALLQTRLNERWSFNAQVNAELLTGEQVANNHRYGTEIGVAYNFRFAGFDYAVVGADASYDHFNKNLSHFTTGHGGYFSPQSYWRAGPFLDFRTAENRPFIIRGRISVGRTGKREDAAPYFPLAPDGRMFPAVRGFGNAYDIEFGGVWQLNDTTQIGAQVTKRHSPQYDDIAAAGFLRVLFEPRKSVLSSDLPTSPAKELF